MGGSIFQLATIDGQSVVVSISLLILTVTIIAVACGSIAFLAAVRTTFANFRAILENILFKQQTR